MALCSRGLISESTDTTYNSAVFMVKKKDGSLHFVCDLRRVNKLLKPYVIQMPKNRRHLQNPHIISTFDLYKGYFSVRLDRKMNNLTAFCSPKTGQSYSWNVLPMGLSVSAGAFVKVVNYLFQDKHKFPYLWYYVDDICISSGNFAEHLTHLNAVFNTLRENMLTINPTKARVGYDDLEFLGHTISANGVRISDSKTKAIQKMVAPKTRKSLQRVLGLLNYFRRHIANYSARTFHMRQLLRLDTKFDWSDQCQ